MTLPAHKVSQPTETCSVKLGGGKPIALNAAGKPEGVPRYEAPAAECPLRLDVTEGGGDGDDRRVRPDLHLLGRRLRDDAGRAVGAAGRHADPRARGVRHGRGVADKSVRDNYKLMTQRARREDVRPIVAEQAAFSADREQFCRSYAREGTHGFCHLRFTENRSLALATRLGANTAAPTTTVAAPRKPRPKPSVEGMNPDAFGGPEPE